MAVQSNLKNMVLCLTGVCLFCSAVLGSVYAVTKEPIAQANAKAVKASIAKVLPEGGELSEVRECRLSEDETYEYYELSTDGKPAAYAVQTKANGFGGSLVLMVGVLPDGTVYDTSVLSHSETPGLGAKCTSDEHFYGQFRNLKTDKPLLVKKDGGSIDAITGSTITSRAYIEAVNKAVKVVKTIGGELKWERICLL